MGWGEMAESLSKRVDALEAAVNELAAEVHGLHKPKPAKKPTPRPRPKVKRAR